MSGYAVFDVETTGLDVHTNAIVEIGVTLTDANGCIEGEFCTLVNPGLPIDPDATDIHQITDAMVAQAPSFSEVANVLRDTIQDRLLVAHNAIFDRSFLHMELARAGLLEDPNSLPRDIPFLCTLEASYQYLPGQRKRTLAHLCGEANIALDNAHEALADTRATAQLLEFFIATHRNQWRAKPLVWDELLARPGVSWVTAPTGVSQGIRREDLV